MSVCFSEYFGGEIISFFGPAPIRQLIGTRIKLRLTIKDGESIVKTEKIAFEFEEGRSLRLEPSVPGFEGLAGLIDASGKPICRLELRNGGFRIARPPGRG